MSSAAWRCRRDRVLISGARLFHLDVEHHRELDDVAMALVITRGNLFPTFLRSLAPFDGFLLDHRHRRCFLAMLFSMVMALVPWSGSRQARLLISRTPPAQSRLCGSRAAVLWARQLPVDNPLLGRFAPCPRLVTFRQTFVRRSQLLMLSDAFGQHQDRTPDARLRGDTRGRDGGVRQKMAGVATPNRRPAKQQPQH